MTTEMINTNDELTLDQLDDVNGGTWIEDVGREIGEYIQEELGIDKLIDALGGFKPMPNGEGDYNPGRPSGSKF